MKASRTCTARRRRTASSTTRSSRAPARKAATMVEKEILVETADGAMTTFVVRPDGEGPFPVGGGLHGRRRLPRAGEGGRAAVRGRRLLLRRARPLLPVRTE